MRSVPDQTVAGLTLLATKLYIPKWRSGLVSRPRLVEQLHRGAERKLTLVTAPAGFGKTTLLAEWLAATPAGEASAGWVSLDQGDNDPGLFWAYVIAALQRVRPGIGANALALLESARPPAIESVLATLINDIAEDGHDIALVLDDVHVIDAQPIHEAIAFFVDHLPPNLLLVLASRSDPVLPLSRLRARGELTELRAADLRFRPDEAAAFLNEMMGLDLSAGDVTALEARTEGWIAGLQLAALSMRGRADVSDFIAAFAGDDRYIVDYLVEEVLQRQPETMRDFLLQTSILERLSGPLCDAVTGRDDSRMVLERLERGNLFLVPLDSRRHWYRYHHLFADVLRAHLGEELPDQPAALHRRASEWYEQTGSPADAIRHAFAAGDFGRAANLVELTATAMRRSRQEATLLGWLRMLPDEVFQCRPVLSAVYGGVLLSNGLFEGVEPLFLNAERWLEVVAGVGGQADAVSAGMIVVDQEEFRRLPALIAVHRAGYALAQGDLARAVRFARHVLDMTPGDEHFYRGAAEAILGLASWTNGDLETAHQSYAEGMASLQRAGYITDSIGGISSLADIRVAQGRLHEAMETYRRTLQRATENSATVLRGTADLHVGMSEIYREWNDLDAARQHVLRSTELGEAAGFPQFPHRWRLALARIREVEGDLDGALDLLDEAERVYVSDFHPDVRPIAAMKVRIWLLQGRLPEAWAWVRERRLSADDDLSYLREFEHITLARVLIATYQKERDVSVLRQAMGLLDRLLEAAESGGRMGSVIEILLLESLAHEAGVDGSGALVPLERALALAEPEGYVRTFVDEGPPMADLLKAATRRGIAPGYAHKLLAAFGSADVRVPVIQDMLDPLSERELDVLRLLGTDLTGPEIANELMVSLNTMRTHTKNIYAKLGVTSRRAAVRLAEERGLVRRAGTNDSGPVPDA
jgi:ATP/maltotriose-dependent transcriptional regulator MalT